MRKHGDRSDFRSSKLGDAQLEDDGTETLKDVGIQISVHFAYNKKALIWKASTHQHHAQRDLPVLVYHQRALKTS